MLPLAVRHRGDAGPTQLRDPDRDGAELAPPVDAGAVTLSALVPSAELEWWKRGAEDRHPYVRHVARGHLATIDG